MQYEIGGAPRRPRPRCVLSPSGPELSETEEDSSREAGRPAVDNGNTDQPINKIKQEREESKAAVAGPPTFSLPVPFPFPHPFLPPAPAYPPQPTHSSASSHSSESSSGSQQTWSFEEQFKQVRVVIFRRLLTTWCYFSTCLNGLAINFHLRETLQDHVPPSPPHPQPPPGYTYHADVSCLYAKHVVLQLIFV
ncbi:unnamed protein product [Nezara viridula]|uniref:Uncharacterized protein n=1 Tax=Nezara viridula TaxID=85310 RepID=A0A9P0E8C3_NEZVI|nr:unnamed protein product [Nezara viridula]